VTYEGRTDDPFSERRCAPLTMSGRRRRSGVPGARNGLFVAMTLRMTCAGYRW